MESLALPFTPVDTMKAKLLIGLSDQSKKPAGGDEVIRAMCKGTLALWENETFQDFLTEAFEDRARMDRRLGRQILGSSHAVNLFGRVLNVEYINMPNFPDAFVDPNIQAGALRGMLNIERFRTSMMFNLSFRNTQSNVPDRYWSLRMIRALLGDELPMHPHIADIGCSQNLGLKQEALQDPLKGFGLIEDNEEQQAAHHKIHERAAKLSSIGASTGFDLFDPIKDKMTKRFARSNSFYPMELKDSEKVQNYDRLDNATPSNIRFVSDDLARPIRKELRHLKGRFNIAFLSTMLYQSDRIHREIVIDNALKLASPAGKIVIQDFMMTPNPGPITDKSPAEQIADKIHIPDEWFGTPGAAYRTVMFDKNRPELGLQDMFEYDSGRCSAIKFGRSALRLLDGQSVGN